MRHKKWGSLEKLDYQIAPIWVIVWIVMYILMIIASLITPEGTVVTIIKLGGIILCLLYSAVTFPRDYLLLLAILTTCLADIVLANNNTSAIGIILFLITQIIHLCRLDGIRLKIPIILWSSFITAILLFDAITQIVPLLYIACGFYVVTLIINIIAAIKWRQREPYNLRALFAILGFTIFACCDICTGISYLSLIGIFSPAIYIPANFFVWFFYYPSQVLISNTGSINPPNIFQNSRKQQC